MSQDKLSELKQNMTDAQSKYYGFNLSLNELREHLKKMEEWNSRLQTEFLDAQAQYIDYVNKSLE